MSNQVTKGNESVKKPINSFRGEMAPVVQFPNCSNTNQPYALRSPESELQTVLTDKTSDCIGVSRELKRKFEKPKH